MTYRTHRNKKTIFITRISLYQDEEESPFILAISNLIGFLFNNK